jgi:hypothetical protein
VTKQEYDALVEFALAKKKNGLSNSQIREELLVYEEDGEQIPSETIKNVLIAADERHLQELQSGGEFRLPKLSTTWKSVILLLFLIPLIIGFFTGYVPGFLGLILLWFGLRYTGLLGSVKSDFTKRFKRKW